MPERPSPIALPDPPLSDGVVTLRPWRRADIPTLVALCNDPLSARFTTIPAPYTTADANDWLGSHAGNLARGESVAFAVVEPRGYSRAPRRSVT